MTEDSSARHALIIGSGIGGLSVSIFLSKLGYRTTVIEKNPLPGGLMRSYTRKGIECPVGVHYLGALDRGQVLRSLFDFLEVSDMIPAERMGSNGVVDKYLYDDFTFDLPPGLDAFEENLCAGFPDEQELIRTYMRMLTLSTQQLRALEFIVSDQGAFQILDQMKPLGAILAEMNCSPRLRGVLAVPSFWLGVPLDRSPAVYHNMSLSSYLESSWRLTCSGSDMANAFAQSLSRSGGEIIRGDGAEEILVDARAVRGVRLASGRVLHAPLVVGAIHPKKVLKLLPARGAIRPVYKNRILKLADTHGIVSVHVAINASNHPEMPHNVFRIETDRGGTIKNTFFIQVRKTGRPGRNLLSILTSGNDERWMPWEETVTGRRGVDYLEAKEQEGVRILREAESILGKLHDPEILDVFTPLTVRDWVGSPGGSAYGVLRSSDQLQSAALLNRCLLEGLYFAGQSVLCPGILGTLLGSLNTVKTIAGPARFRSFFQL
jgi:phytoene dehydrogenase-like protein